MNRGFASIFACIAVSFCITAPSMSQAQSRASSRSQTVNTADVKQVIKNIEVKGLKKLEADFVLGQIESRAGGVISPSVIQKDIKALFKTGYFEDIQVLTADAGLERTLVFQMKEKPILAEIKVEGNDELKEDEILTTMGLKAFEFFNREKMQIGIDKVEKLYQDKGFFLTRITPEITPVVEGETLKLVLKVVENDKVKVQKITFLGNLKLSDSFLKGKMITTEGGFFSFLSGSGAFKEDAFERDVQVLRYAYFNEGYVQVKMERPLVTVTPDKKSIYITIRVDEGEQFDVGEIDFAGDLLFPREELLELVSVNQQTVFSFEKMQADLSSLQAKYGDLGYAFANVIPRTRINEKERKVDITFEFEKGNKVYLGAITTSGNSRTRDKVIRRELRIREGELYNETRKRESIERVQRLGFFEEVNFKTSTPPGQPDKMDIEIVVKERNTGQVTLSAGYGSSSGFALQGQLSENNFLGKGQRLAAGLSIAGDRSDYNISFTEPYFKDTEWSLGSSVYQSQVSRTEYNERKLGGTVSLGHPLSDDLSASLRYKLDDTKLTDATDTITGVSSTDQTLFPLATASGITSSLTGTVEYDQRNDRFSPSKGIYASTSLEYAGLGGDLKYTKANGTVRYFKKAFWDIIWRNNISYSVISSHDVGQDPPFNELYLLGGPYSLRGYRFNRVGRTKFSDKIFNDTEVIKLYPDPAERAKVATRPFGGRQQLLYQTELQAPLISEAGINAVIFYDIGQAEDAITSSQFYSDVGFGFRWFSPIGPLRFEWGFPLRKLEIADDPVVFEFSIGTPF